MKTLFKITFLISLFSLVSCINEKDLNDVSGDDENLVTSGPMQGMNVSDDFDYSTSMDVQLNLTVPDFLKNAVFSIYSKSGSGDSLNLGKATFNDNGVYSRTLTLSTTTDSLLIYSNYIGMTKDVRLAVTGNSVNFDYNSYYSDAAKMPDYGDAVKNPEDTNYSYISPYNTHGVPTSLSNSDHIDHLLLDDVNNSLPESAPGGIPVTHPEFLAGKDTELTLVQDADLWVTFVSEGAGYKNALGFYTYTVGNEPATVNDIDTHYVIFPNVSMHGSGGKLIPGHRVHIGTFPANTVISWFLVADGWDGAGVKSWAQVYYANSDFNPETTEAKRQHMVMLHDQGRNLNLLGFEDLHRDGGSDDDFNDAVFYVKANPITAVSNGNTAVLDAANDSDNDGITDALDEFPYDNNKAFTTYYPSAQNNGTLAFEDLWPSTGDYDFNDLVLDYNFSIVTNGNNLATSITAHYTVEHIGASFHNGFAFVLPIAPSNVASVTGQVLNGGYEQVSANGTESGTAANETVIYVSGDTHAQTGQTITVTVNLNTPAELTALGTVPFNTFLISNGERGREVHLPDHAPTSKALYLGTGNDYSDPAYSRYYKTDFNLPWALNIYDNFEYPSETTPIIDVYPRFKTWANSGGTTDMDWYKD